MMKRQLSTDEEGVATIEVALTLPILITLIYGVFQVSMALYANARMHHALGEGARYATLFVETTSLKHPTAAQVKTRMESELTTAADGSYTVADPITGVGYFDLQVSHTRTMDFIFFPGPTLTLTATKRAYLAIS